MAHSQYPNVTDELLSAYIDGVVTTAERALVEEAAANDLQIAWRLDTLRQTVALLGQLSDVPLPRSFTVSEAMLAESTSASPAAVRAAPQPSAGLTEAPSFWERWQRFWGSGNALWRNAAAVCAVLLLLVLVGDNLTTQQNGSSVETFSAKIAAQDDVPDEAAEVAMAPVAIALDTAEANDAAQLTDAEPIALDETIETETDNAEIAQAAAGPSSPGVITSDGDLLTESAQTARSSPPQVGAVAGQAGADAAPASLNSAALSTMPQKDAADIVITASSAQTTVIAAPQPIMDAGSSARESPLAFDLAAVPPRGEMVASGARSTSRRSSAESNRAAFQATRQRRSPAVGEAGPPTDTPSIVALAEPKARTDEYAGLLSSNPAAAAVDVVSEAPTNRQVTLESRQETTSSFWSTVNIAGQALLLLLLILFAALWLRSRSSRTAAG